uniref:Uncharacterized protein n=1 Tax=Arundo donax TaxID=35708 RepID=A0A0A9PPK0_ARUDO
MKCSSAILDTSDKSQEVSSCMNCNSK